jgi:uncharacterized protein (TIGR03437 family)
MTSLRRAVLACLFAAALAPAQYRNLATTRDGARLFFISALRQRGTDQHLYTKIFSLDAAGVTLVLQLPAPADIYSRYTLDALQSAPDASWLNYGKLRNCVGGSSCFLNEQHSSILMSKWFDGTLAGNARLSADARWEVDYSSPNAMIRLASRKDRQFGASVNLPAYPYRTPSVATNGTVLIPASDALSVWDGATSRKLAGRTAAAVMDDAATTVVYENLEKRLRVVDLATSREWTLGAEDRDNTAPQISSDGRSVLYLSRMYDGPQVFFSARDGSGWKQLTDEQGGIQEAVLSGDGRVAWAVSANGAILRIDTVNAAIDRPVPATPFVTHLTPGAPGTAAEADGSSLGSTDVRIAGRAAPLLYSSSSALLFQIPWETRAEDVELTLDTGTGPFLAAFPYEIRDINAAVVPLGPETSQGPAPVAIHQDWGSLVTVASPARPGEIVHLYATGLGPVYPTVPTGTASPAVPLSSLATPVQWTWDSDPADVLFAGLAPGLIGYYQLEVRIPQTVTTSALALTLHWVPPQGGSFSWGLASIPVSQQ